MTPRLEELPEVPAQRCRHSEPGEAVRAPPVESGSLGSLKLQSMVRNVVVMLRRVLLRLYCLGSEC